MKKILKFFTLILCLLLTVVLCINITMIVKSYINKDKVPDFLGYKPFIVLSGSMEPTIMTGDLLIVKMVDATTIVLDDIIAFRLEDGTVVTHRVIEVNNEGELSFATKGDNNTGNDNINVVPDTIEGKYICRIPAVGRFAIFLQTPIGLLIFVVLPLLTFILYDTMIKGRNKKGRETELEEELKKLRQDKEANTIKDNETNSEDVQKEDVVIENKIVKRSDARKK